MESLIEMASGYSVQYVLVKFPLSFNRGQYHFGEVSFDDFSRDGLTYLLYRLGTHVDRKKARNFFFNGSRQNFVHYVNQCRNYQESASIREAHRPQLIAALVTRDNHTELWGLLTNYTAVSNRSVLERIQNSNLPSAITYTRFSPKEMLIFCRSRDLGKTSVQYGLALRNGETGHTTLSYLLAVYSDDYIFCFPPTDRRRHLSRVGEVNLDDVFDAINDLEIHNLMETTQVGTLHLKLTGYPDVLVNEILEHPARSIANTLPVLLRLRREKGLKTAAETLLDSILAKVDEL